MMRKLLIFDLDETLVHASPALLERASDFEVSPYFIYVRPHISEVLAALAPHYDFAVWSSSSQDYVDTVTARVFGTQFELKFAWSVERCVQRADPRSNSYVYIKDLRKVQSQGYEVSRITILDDSPEKIARQPKNHLPLRPYLGCEPDTELLRIADLLLAKA
jgi:carboxy-terminal domain RNA polymerase II polypeptide A small phosphatase